MAGPRVKRPFAGSSSDPSQRQITNFFARGENHAAAAAADRSSPREANTTPRLPASVQANLLAVGMRVRKSVPEGYKTKKDDDDNQASRSLSRTTTTTTAAPRADRELVPFCGLHKVGGLGVQASGNDADRPLFASSLFGSMDGGGGDDDMSLPPSLTSSQDTVSSAADSIGSSSWSSRTSQQPPQYYRLSSPPRWADTKPAPMGTGNKRGYGAYDDDDEDEDEDDELDHENPPPVHPTLRVFEDDPYRFSSASSINGWLAGSASPATTTTTTTMLPPSSQTWQAPLSSRPSQHFQNGRRVLAVPRRRQQQQWQQPEARAKSGLVPMDQENVDFDEADFLDATVLGDGHSSGGGGGVADLQMGGM